VAVSVDPPETTRAHLAKTGWTYTFLSDQKGELIRRLDLLDSSTGTPVGIARPAEFLIDPAGTVRSVDLTDDFRVRTRPQTVLDAFDRAQGE
jgi:peroxiredoxin